MIIDQKIVVLMLLIITVQVKSLCEQPQKAIFMSLNSIANRDHIEKLFTQISDQTSGYSMTYFDKKTQQNYRLYSINYKIAYNNHYQKEKYIDSKTVKVELGVVTILAQIKYNITDKNNNTLHGGSVYARSYLDPASFQKNIVQVNKTVEWNAGKIDLLYFNALWVLEPTDMPEKRHHLIESILNGVVEVDDLKSHIATEINILYKIYIYNYISADPLFSTAQMSYQYRNITMPIDHSVKSIQINQESQGLVGLINFGIDNAKQDSCGSVPTKFIQKDYGGVVEYITMGSVKFMVLQALNKGLFNVNLDKSWESDVFQFYMGDLGNAVRYADNFGSTQDVGISCKSENMSKVIVSQFNDTHLYVEVPERCQVSYKDNPVIEVVLQLIVLAKIGATNDALLVQVSQFYARKINYNSLDSHYKVQRTDVAEMMISSILQKIVSSQTFGSKIPTVYRNYPAVIINAQHLIIFDYSEMNARSSLMHKAPNDI